MTLEGQLDTCKLLVISRKDAASLRLLAFLFGSLVEVKYFARSLGLFAPASAFDLLG